MKKFAIATTLAVGVLTLSACSEEETSKEVVVETEAGDVTKEEFYQELMAKNGEAVLQQLVLEKVLTGNYEVTDEELEQELSVLKEQYGDQFESLLQQSGFADVEEFKEVLRINLLQEKAVTEDIEVTDEEIQQRYDRMQTEIVARHILVKDEETAQEVNEKLENGESFADLVKEYSTDTASAQNDGELPAFSVGEMVPAFEDAAYGLEKGEISEPIQSEHGWHIIEVLEKNKKEDVAPLEEVKDTLRREIAASKVDNAAAQEKMNQLMEDAGIEVKIEQFKGLFDKSAPAEGEATDKNADKEKAE